MWNGRVSLTVVAAVALLVALCALVGAVYAPDYADRRGAILTANAVTQLAQVNARTQAANATNVAHQPTETAIAGATRNRKSPAPTATAGGSPGARRRRAARCGRGRARRGHQHHRPARRPGLGAGGPTADGVVAGSIRSDMLNLPSGTCQANIYDLSYLLGLVDAGTVVADDTLISNENASTNGAGNPLSPVLSAYGEAQLVLTTNGVDTLRPALPACKTCPPSAHHLVRARQFRHRQLCGRALPLHQPHLLRSPRAAQLPDRRLRRQRVGLHPPAGPRRQYLHRQSKMIGCT